MKIFYSFCNVHFSRGYMTSFHQEYNNFLREIDLATQVQFPLEIHFLGEFRVFYLGIKFQKRNKRFCSKTIQTFVDLFFVPLINTDVTRWGWSTTFIPMLSAQDRSSGSFPTGKRLPWHETSVLKSYTKDPRHSLLNAKRVAVSSTTNIYFLELAVMIRAGLHLTTLVTKRKSFNQLLLHF